MAERAVLDNVADTTSANFTTVSNETGVWLEAGGADLKLGANVIATLSLTDPQVIIGFEGVEYTLLATAASTTVKVIP